jgi:hypothetical protein
MQLMKEQFLEVRVINKSKSVIFLVSVVSIIGCCSRKYNMNMSMGHLWNEHYEGNLKHSEKTLFQCYVAHHKCHMDWSGIELGLSVCISC